MICKCGGNEFFTEEHGNHTGLYCSACGKWQKWLKKDEIRLFNHGVKVENASMNGAYCDKCIGQIADTPKLYTRHEVAEIIAELFGDTCACNFNGIDEWLPEKCELLSACPNPVGVACWEQYLKYRNEVK